MSNDVVNHGEKGKINANDRVYWFRNSSYTLFDKYVFLHMLKSSTRIDLLRWYHNKITCIWSV